MLNYNVLYQYRKLFLLVFFPFLNILSSQECDSGFVWIEDVPVCCGGEQNCFYEGDLDVLQTLIDNSSETINMLLDDNEDGIIEAIMLDENENQVWEILTVDEDLNGYPEDSVYTAYQPWRNLAR